MSVLPLQCPSNGQDAARPCARNGLQWTALIPIEAAWRCPKIELIRAWTFVLKFCPKGVVQSSRGFTQGLRTAFLTSGGVRPCFNRPRDRRIVNGYLLTGHPVDHNDEQDHHQYADQRPNPHHPAHPSIRVVHHKSPFAALRTTHRQ